MPYKTVNKNDFLTALAAATGASPSEAANMLQQLRDEGDVFVSNERSLLGGIVTLVSDAVNNMWTQYGV
ncbi:hypothetical protein ACEPPN_003742 [Leptodophora sp. 'Broadleaf-Isolate-01']